MITKEFASNGKDLVGITVEAEVDLEKYNVFWSHNCRLAGKYQGAIGGGVSYSFTEKNDNLEVKIACYCSHEQDVTRKGLGAKKQIRQGADIDAQAYERFKNHHCMNPQETYIITPTTIGSGIMARCSCGLEQNITDYRNW